MNDQNLNIKFVQEVEKYPCLYNSTLSEYSHRGITERAWRAVGKTFDFSEHQSREKWKNLRAVFVRHIKPKSTSSSKYTRPYYLFDAMQFVIPYIRTSRNTESRNISQDEAKEDTEEDSKEDSEEENDSILQQNMPSPYFKRSPSPENQQLAIVNSTPTSPSQSASKTDFIKRRKTKPSIPDEDDMEYKRRKTKPSIPDEDDMEYFQAREVENDHTYNQLKEDHKKMFLLSLLPDLQVMSDSQTRTFKRKVMDLVIEILDGSPASSIPRQQDPLGYKFNQDN